MDVFTTIWMCTEIHALKLVGLVDVFTSTSTSLETYIRGCIIRFLRIVSSVRGRNKSDAASDPSFGVSRARLILES